MCLRFSDWPISIHNWVYIFPSCFFGTYSDVLCSEECQTKKLLVCCKMFAFFKAIFNDRDLWQELKVNWLKTCVTVTHALLSLEAVKETKKADKNDTKEFDANSLDEYVSDSSAMRTTEVSFAATHLGR